MKTKGIIAIILTVFMLIGLIAQTEIVDAENLTLEHLESRNGKIIIEKVVGVVYDDNGNGTALFDESYYIYYGKVNNASKGDKVLSYFIYNPFNNYFDDIMIRFDHVMEA